MHANRNTTFLTATDVCHRTTLSRPELHLSISDGTFPKPLVSPTGQLLWCDSEINHWIESRPRMLSCFEDELLLAS